MSGQVWPGSADAVVPDTLNWIVQPDAVVERSAPAPAVKVSDPAVS